MSDTVVSVRVDDDLLEYIDGLADQHGTTRSEVARHLLDNGTRAHKYYPEFEIDPQA